MNFEAVASIYDKGRPNYPKEMFADLEKIGALQAPLKSNITCLEIGSGSGQATAQLLPYVSGIACVEPGKAMCRILREKFSNENKVNINNNDFESHVSDLKYQLVFAGNSLHWIYPDVAYRKISNFLCSGGWLVAAWNMPQLSDLVIKLASTIISPHDPEFDIPVVRSETAEYFASGFEDFSVNRGFESCQHRSYHSQRIISAENMSNLIWSYVGVAAMSKDSIASVLKELQNCLGNVEPSELKVNDTFIMGCGQKA